jgi:predicted RNA binding protein with dsRBD fold (UPF0201 family)
MSEYAGDLLKADDKIQLGTEWKDTISIPMAGEKLEFGFSLLDERPRQKLQNELPLDELREYKSDGMSDEQKRLMELQRKDELTEEEEEEFLELNEEVNPEEEGREKLSNAAVDKLMDAGKHALEPTEDDVSDLMGAPPDKQEDILGEIPDHLDHDEAKDALREYMQERLEEQPFPIKYVLGQRAYMETVSVLGNGFQETST